VSSIPMMMSPSSGSSSTDVWGKPKKSQDLVVKRSSVLLGKTETTPFMPKDNKEKSTREMLALQFIPLIYQLKVFLRGISIKSWYICLGSSSYPFILHWCLYVLVT
jgi:hypothetical protein